MDRPELLFNQMELILGLAARFNLLNPSELLGFWIFLMLIISRIWSLGNFGFLGLWDFGIVLLFWGGFTIFRCGIFAFGDF